MSRITRTGSSLLLAAGMVVLVGAALSLGGEAQAATAEEQGFSVPAISYRGTGQPLMPSQAGMPATVADFLSQKGWATETIDSLRVKSEIATRKAGKVVVLDQEVDGLTVYGSRLKAVFDDNGNLLSLGGSMVAVTGSVLLPQIEARDALDTAMAAVHPNVSVGLAEIDRVENTITYGSDSFFYTDPKVTNVAVPTRGGPLAEGFLVEIWTDEDNQLNHVLVGGNGQVLEVQNRTANAQDSYLIFLENPDADGGVQTPVSGPDPVTPPENVPSPDGWIDTGATQYETDIQGNNANAYLDQDNNNGPDPGGVVDSDLDFDATANLSDDPLNGDNPAVAVQNLSYLNNLIHDELYRHGFTESAGNFQEDNFGRGGSGSDSVNAEAQDGGGTNNANFATPSDGSNPRMQMYLWNRSDPRRDGSVDGDIVVHEYGHGLTWRMIGNMTGIMGGALGEGWSDTLATVRYDDDVVAEYSVNDPGGIRSSPYGDYESTGRTYESITGTSVHSDGEIFGAITWDMWTRYRDDASGATGGDIDTRRNTIMDDFVEGMTFTDYQCNRPTFPTVRNGILEAISGSSDPLAAPSDASDLARWCHTWEAFAKFGVGVDQTTTCRQRGIFLTWEWFNGFNIPAECVGPPLPPNEPPVLASPIADQMANEDTPFNLDISGNFSDPDNGPQPLAYSVTGPNWVGIDASTGILSGTPTNDDVGTSPVTVTASDGQNSVSDTFVMTVNNTNDAPVLLTPIADQAAVVDTPFNLDVSGNFDDVDVGDVLTFSAELDGGGGLPGWLSFDANTGVFSGTPLSADVGTITVAVTASDGLASVSDTFDITVSEGGSGTPDACDGLADDVYLTPSSTNQGSSWTAIVDAVKCSGGDEEAFTSTGSWDPDLGGSVCSTLTGVCQATQSGIRKRTGSVQFSIEGATTTVSKP